MQSFNDTKLILFENIFVNTKKFPHKIRNTNIKKYKNHKNFLLAKFSSEDIKTEPFLLSLFRMF